MWPLTRWLWWSHIGKLATIEDWSHIFSRSTLTACKGIRLCTTCTRCNQTLLSDIAECGLCEFPLLWLQVIGIHVRNTLGFNTSQYFDTTYVSDTGTTATALQCGTGPRKLCLDTNVFHNIQYDCTVGYQTTIASYYCLQCNGLLNVVLGNEENCYSNKDTEIIVLLNMFKIFILMKYIRWYKLT